MPIDGHAFPSLIDFHSISALIPSLSGFMIRLLVFVTQLPDKFPAKVTRSFAK
jgi:hypothetical protein